jgi:hypothetical protein
LEPDPRSASSPDGGGGPSGGLDRRLCQVGGVNQNYLSPGGTQYHIQIEDFGPIFDRTRETEVRRLNVIIYANYGEAHARIVHGRDHDFEDVRSQEHNRFIGERIQALVSQAREIIEEKERREVGRIKALIREYYRTKDEQAKRSFEEANAQYPFLFSRAWMELKAERGRGPLIAVEEAVVEPPVPLGQEPDTGTVEVVYPMDEELRRKVIEIESLVLRLSRDLLELKAQGNADDILLQTYRKLVARAKDTLEGREPSEFNSRRLDSILKSLTTTWKTVQSRLRG